MKNENCLVGGKSNDLVKKRAFEDISGYNKGASPSPNKMRKPQNPKKSFQSFKMRKSAAVTQKEPSKLSVDHSDALQLDANSTSTGVNTQYPRQKQEGAL